MRIGAILSQADAGTDAATIRGYAQGLESVGYDHLMAYDHLLGASAERLSTGHFGGFGSPPYTDQHTFHEILVLFSHLAGVTTTLEFVTSVLVLPQRQTAVVAKQMSTIDLLSGGRLRLAVGVGWNWAEYEALGADFGARTDVLEEQIQVMRKLWTQPLVTFSGNHHHRHGFQPRLGRRQPARASGAGARVPPRGVADGQSRTRRHDGLIRCCRLRRDRAA